MTRQRTPQVPLGPLHLSFVLGALVGGIPCLLSLVVAHGVGQDAVVLKALGGKHGQSSHNIAVIALDACPLHGGVVGLGLLDDPLVHLVHGFPVGFAALLRGTLAEFCCMVLHIPLRALPQRRHRDLVHAGDPAGQMRHFTHGFFYKSHVCAHRRELALLCSPQSVLQQGVSVLAYFCFHRGPLFAREILHEGQHRRHGVRSQHSARRGQAGRLRDGHARVQSQHSPRIQAASSRKHRCQKCFTTYLFHLLQIGQ